MAGSITINGSFKPDAREWNKIWKEIYITVNESAEKVAKTLERSIYDDIVKFGEGTFFESCKLIRFLKQKFDSQNKSKAENSIAIEKIINEIKKIFNRDKNKIIILDVRKINIGNFKGKINTADILVIKTDPFFQKSEELAIMLETVRSQMDAMKSRKFQEGTQYIKNKTKTTKTDREKGQKDRQRDIQHADAKLVENIIKKNPNMSPEEIAKVMNNSYDRLSTYKNDTPDQFTKTYIERLISKYNLYNVKALDADISPISTYGFETLNFIDDIDVPLVDINNAIRSRQREYITDLRGYLQKYNIKDQIINNLLYASEIYTLIDPSQSELFVEKDTTTGQSFLQIKKGATKKEDLSSTVKTLQKLYEDTKNDIGSFPDGDKSEEKNALILSAIEIKRSLKYYSSLLEDKKGETDYNQLFNELYPFIAESDWKYTFAENEDLKTGRITSDQTTYEIGATETSPLYELYNKGKDVKKVEKEARSLWEYEFFKDEFSRIAVIKATLDPFKELFEEFMKIHEKDIEKQYEALLDKTLNEKFADFSIF